MERAALIGGILLAVVIAIGSSVDHFVDIRIDDDDWDGHHMQRAAYVEPAPGGAMAAQTFAEHVVRVIHTAGRVRVIPEERTDISVEITNPGRAPMPTVKAEEGKVVIDGRLARRIEECHDDGAAELDGYGTVALDQLPQITIHTPRDIDLGLRGAVTGEIGAAQSVDLDQSGCGRSTVGDVVDRLELHNSGSGEIEAGAARTAEVHLAGSGAAKLGAISERLEVHIAGSGEVHAASLQGGLEVRTAGSGDMSLGGGAVTDAQIEIAGSGSADIAAPVAALEVKIAGSGDVTVTQPVGSVDASLAGSGDVIVASLTGDLSKSVIGSGDVIVRTPAPAASGK